MVKPAAVEHELINPARRPQQRLHLVEIDVTNSSQKATRKFEPQKPEVADDLDDMWDNVPV